MTTAKHSLRTIDDRLRAAQHRISTAAEMKSAIKALCENCPACPNCRLHKRLRRAMEDYLNFDTLTYKVRKEDGD